MQRLFNRLSIKAKLWTVTAINILALAGMMLVILPAAHRFTVELEAEKARALSETALGIAMDFNARATAGEMTEEEAKTRFSETIRAMRYEDGQYIFVSRYDGRSFVNPGNPSIEGKDLSNVVDQNGFRFVPAMVQAARGGGGRIDYWWPMPGSEEPARKVSYVFGIEPWDMFVGTGFYTANVDATFATLQWMALGAGATSVLIVAFASWLVARNIAIPARELADRVGRLAAGEIVGDSAHGGRADAIGAIARAVTLLRAGVIERIELQKAQAEAEERQRIQEAETMMRMADSLDSRVSTEIVDMRERVGCMVGQTDVLRDLAERMRATATETFAACQEGSSSVQVVAAAAEELSASSGELSRQVAGTAATSRDAVVAAETAARSIDTLAVSSRSIGEVTKLINAIAEQTNLLALNATIEAARAGDAGRGFSIVAQEVKNLAEQTAKATADIESQIRAMQAETNQSVEAIDGIVKTINRVSDNTSSMAAALEEQDAAIREIAASILAASGSTELVSNNMGRMRTSADETSEAVGTVHDASEQLDGRSGALKSAVDGFLANLRRANTAATASQRAA